MVESVVKILLFVQNFSPVPYINSKRKININKIIRHQKIIGIGTINTGKESWVLNSKKLRITESNIFLCNDRHNGGFDTTN